MMSLQQQQRKTEMSWDATGDGIIDAQDFLDNFDKDKDGLLDKSELDRLGNQLSSQLAFNNQLLTQIKSMEQAKLTAQRDSKATQERIQKLLHQNAELKNDLNETKRKLKVSQEIVENTTRQSKDSRGESISLRQELEAATKSLSELQGSFNITHDEKIRLEASLQDQLARHADSKESLDQVTLSSKQEVDALNKSKEQLNNMLSDMRKKITPLGLENKEIKTQLAELQRSYTLLKNSEERERNQRELSEKNMKEMLLQLDQAKGELGEAKFRLEAVSGKHADALNQSKQVESNSQALLARIDASEKEVVSINIQIEEITEEKEALHHEILNLQKDLDTLAQQRQNENDIWAEKYVTLQGEMVTAQEEAKDRFNASLADAKSRIVSAVKDRKSAEEKLHSAQQGLEISIVYSL